MLLAIGITDSGHRQTILKSAVAYKERSKDAVLKKAKKLTEQAARATATAEATAKVLGERKQEPVEEAPYMVRRSREEQLAAERKARAAKVRSSGKPTCSMSVTVGIIRGDAEATSSCRS